VGLFSDPEDLPIIAGRGRRCRLCHDHRCRDARPYRNKVLCLPAFNGFVFAFFMFRYWPSKRRRRPEGRRSLDVSTMMLARHLHRALVETVRQLPLIDELQAAAAVGVY
jgi:hypothetical protein